MSVDTYFCTAVPTMDANDCFVRIGWCPEVVRVTKISDGQDNMWCRLMGNDASLSRVAAGDRTANTDRGIKLVQFDKETANQSSDPTTINPEEWYKANGVQLTADIAFLADDNIVLVEAWRSLGPRVIKAVHDGGDATNTYIQDASIDFSLAGVSEGFVVYNLTNGNYAFVGDVQKPQGQKKYCRLTLVDAAGNATTAADIDDDDVLYVYPPKHFPYPYTDIGIMT